MIHLKSFHIKRFFRVGFLGLMVVSCGPLGAGGDFDQSLESPTVEISESGILKVEISPQTEPHRYQAQVSWDLGEGVDTESLMIERHEAESKVIRINISGQSKGSIFDNAFGDGQRLEYRLVQGVGARTIEFAKIDVGIPKDWVIDGVEDVSKHPIFDREYGRIFFKKSAVLKTGATQFHLKAKTIFIEKEARLSNFFAEETAPAETSGKNGGTIQMNVGEFKAWNYPLIPNFQVIARGQKGGIGAKGERGRKGRNGMDGTNGIVGVSGGPKCTWGIGGGGGDRGGPGEAGGRGHNGGNAGEIKLQIEMPMSVVLHVDSIGGLAGEGGLGGEGGEGGEGGRGGYGCRKEPDGPRGEQGSQGPRGESGSPGQSNTITVNGQRIK